MSRAATTQRIETKTAIQLFIKMSDRSRSESWKGGEAFSLNKPDVLEQQSHLSSNRGVDCHELREGGGHQQHQWADDDMFPPSSSMRGAHTCPKGRPAYGEKPSSLYSSHSERMSQSPIGTNSRRGGGSGDEFQSSHTKDGRFSTMQPKHHMDDAAGRVGRSKPNGWNSSGNERWRKRGELDTAQQRVNVSSSTEFPGRGGDSFQSGGSSSSSGRVWPSEKDRGAASSPIGRQQILYKEDVNHQSRNPLPQGPVIGRGCSSDQHPSTPPTMSSRRSSPPINTDIGVDHPPSLGSSFCALERGDIVGGEGAGSGAGASSVKRSRFHDSKELPSTEELCSKPPPPPVFSSSPGQDRSNEGKYERGGGSYRDGRKWDRERSRTSGRHSPNRYIPFRRPSASGSQSQPYGYTAPSSSQPGGERIDRVLRETDNEPSAVCTSSNLPDNSEGGGGVAGGRRWGWKERDFVSSQPPPRESSSSPHKYPLSKRDSDSGGGSWSWGANRPGKDRTSSKAAAYHSSSSRVPDCGRQSPNIMNHRPKRFKHHAPKKLDYYGPCSNNNSSSEFGVERATSWSKSSSGGGNGTAYEVDKYSGYPSSNGELRSTRGTGGSSSGGDAVRHDPSGHPKEISESRSSSIYSHNEQEQGGGGLMVQNSKMGEFWPEQQIHQSGRGMTNVNDPKSRAVHQQQHQLPPPRQQQWQSNVRSSSFPSKRGLSGTDFPDFKKGRVKSHGGDMPAVNMRPEGQTKDRGGVEEGEKQLESSRQLSGRVVATSLEETDHGWHPERAHILHEMEEGECTPTPPPPLVSSRSLPWLSYPSVAAHKQQERSGALLSPPPPPPVVEEMSLLWTPSHLSSAIQERYDCTPSQKETSSSSSSTIAAVQSEAAPAAVSQSSPVVPPPKSTSAMATPTPVSDIAQQPSPLSVTQHRFGQGLLDLIGTSSSALFPSPQGSPSAYDTMQSSSSMQLDSSSDMNLDKPPSLSSVGLESSVLSINSSKTLELENVSKLKTLEPNGAAAKPAGQQPPLRLGWGMSLNRWRSTESSSSSLMPPAKEAIEMETKETTPPIVKEEVINNDQLILGSQGSKRAAAVPAATAASSITPGNDSGPKRLSWGMNLRKPIGIGKSMSKGSSPSRCNDTTAAAVSSFHQASSIGKLVGDSPSKEPPFPTQPTRDVILSDTPFHDVSAAAVKTKEAAMCDTLGGDEENLQLATQDHQWENGNLINMPCKRKKEEIEEQQTPKLFKTKDHCMLSSPVETKAKEMVQNKNEDFFPAVTATTAANISDGLENLVSHQPPLPTQKRICMKEEDTMTSTSVKLNEDVTVLSSTSQSSVRDMPSLDHHVAEVIVNQPTEYMGGGLKTQPELERKTKQPAEEESRHAVAKAHIEEEAQRSTPFHPATSNIPSLRLDMMKSIMQTAESTNTTAVEKQRQDPSLPVITASSPTSTQPEKMAEKNIATMRGKRELASLTESGSTLYGSTSRRGSGRKFGFESIFMDSSKVASVPSSPMGSTASKRRRRSVNASRIVDKEGVQWDESSSSSSSTSLPLWDPFVSTLTGGASTIRILDVVKTPEDTVKAIEALQYLRFLEGHRKDVICRVAISNAPLPLPHVFQSALGKVRMKLREIDRQLTYKEKELDAQQRRKENKLLFDEASCDSMDLDAKVWDNPVSLVEAISKAKAVRHMLLAWSEQLPQTLPQSPRDQHQYEMKNSLQGPTTTTATAKTQTTIPQYYSLSPQVNALYRHSDDLESVAKILTFNRCLAMAAQSASTVHHHYVNCILPHQKRQLEPTTSPQIASRIAKAVSRRRKDINRRWESLGSGFALQYSNWKNRISMLEKRENKDDITSPKGGMLRYAVRSDYEQEQILVELVAKEAKERRIANGYTSPPNMLNAMERSQLQEISISFGSVDNPWNTADGERMLCEDFPLRQSCPQGCNCFRAMEKDARIENPWTDKEKCIFLQLFLVHPKDFFAIAQHLPNKQTKDVVRFYYDTKQYVDYKEVLKEHTQRVREKMRGIITEEKGGGIVRWPATLSAANCMGTAVSLTDPSDPTSLVFELPSEGSYTTLHAHPPAALTTISDLKREALELSRRGVVRKIQAPLGLKGVKSGMMTMEQLDEVDVSATTLNLAAYHLALSLSPTLGRDPPPFRRSSRDIGLMSYSGSSLVGLHLCGVIETSSRGGAGGRGHGNKLRDGDYLCNKESDEADLQLFLRNQNSIGSNSSSINLNSNAAGGNNQNLRRKGKVVLPQSSDHHPEKSPGEVIRTTGQKWKEEEKEAFLSHFSQVGKDWLALAKAIPGKATNQIKNYYQNYKVKLGLVEPAVKSIPNNNNNNNVNAAAAATTKAEDEVRKDMTQLSLSGSTGLGAGAQQPPSFTTREVEPSVVALDATTIQHHSGGMPSGSGDGGASSVNNLNDLTTPFLQCPVYGPHHSSLCDDGHQLDQQGNPSCSVASDHLQASTEKTARHQLHLELNQQQQPAAVRAEGEGSNHSIPPFPCLPIESNNHCSYAGKEGQRSAADSISVGGDEAMRSSQSCCATDTMNSQQCSGSIQVQQQEEEGGVSTSMMDDQPQIMDNNEPSAYSNDVEIWDAAPPPPPPHSSPDVPVMGGADKVISHWNATGSALDTTSLQDARPSNGYEVQKQTSNMQL